ncbi:MAG: PilZ domain-containing protein [Planctomycetota bacterium]
MILPRIARDRRRHPRVPAAHPVKLKCGITGRYLAGRTIDVSDGGCLLQLDRSTPVSLGQPVRLGIARRAHAPLLMADDMVRGTIVRRQGQSDAQHVAVAYENATALAEAG